MPPPKKPWQWRRRANVKTLILYHLSIRYDRATALPTLRAQLAASGFAGDCWLLDEDVLRNTD